MKTKNTGMPCITSDIMNLNGKVDYLFVSFSPRVCIHILHHPNYQSCCLNERVVNVKIPGMVKSQ